MTPFHAALILALSALAGVALAAVTLWWFA
jgi:hypothetical protein